MADPAPLNTAPIDDDLVQAAHAFFPALTAVEAVAGHPTLARVATPAGLWRAQLWPPTAVRNRAAARAAANLMRVIDHGAWQDVPF